MSPIDLRERDVLTARARHESDDARAANVALSDALRALTVAILSDTLHKAQGQAALLQAKRLLNIE